MKNPPTQTELIAWDLCPACLVFAGPDRTGLLLQANVVALKVGM